MRRFLHSYPDIVALCAVVLGCGVLFAWLQNPTSLDDGLRHFAMARIMAEKGILHTNGWREFLYEGYLSKTMVDPWFLSNALLVPFARFPVAAALKILTAFQVFAVATASLLMLRSLKLSRLAAAALLLLLFFGDQQFFGRLLLARPFGLITALTIISAWAIIERRYALLTLSIALSALLSQLFVFTTAIACIGCSWLLIGGKRQQAGICFLSIIIGLAFGLLIHPHTTAYVLYLYDAFIRIPFLNAEVGLSNEMQSGIMDISAISVFIAIGAACLLGSIAWCKKLPLSRIQPWMYFSLISAFLLPMFFLWVRTIDLLWPMLIFLIASLWAGQGAYAWNYVCAIFTIRWVRLIVLVLATGQICIVPYTFIRDDIDKSLADYKTLNLIPSGSRVLNTDWNRFFAYVAVRPDLHYATGIDPVFTYLTDPRATEIIRSLKNPMVKNEQQRMLIRELYELYPARYIVLYKDTFMETVIAMYNAKEWSMVSQSGSIVIFTRAD